MTPSWSFSFVNRIEKNIGKWSETSDLIIPLFRELLKVSVVKILSIRLADCSVSFSILPVSFNCYTFSMLFMKGNEQCLF